VLLIVLGLGATRPVSAESAFYRSGDGPWCYFKSTGPTHRIGCFGVNQAAGGLVLFACDAHISRSGSTVWFCADNYGNRWGASS